jgi:hypothetical protein
MKRNDKYSLQLFKESDVKKQRQQVKNSLALLQSVKNINNSKLIQQYSYEDDSDLDYELDPMIPYKPVKQTKRVQLPLTVNVAPKIELIEGIRGKSNLPQCILQEIVLNMNLPLDGLEFIDDLEKAIVLELGRDPLGKIYALELT